MQHSTRSHGRDSRRAERWSLLAAPQLMLLARSRRRADRRPPTAGRIPVRGSYPARRAPAHVHTDLQSSSRLPTGQRADRRTPTADRRPPTADCRLPSCRPADAIPNADGRVSAGPRLRNSHSHPRLLSTCDLAARRTTDHALLTRVRPAHSMQIAALAAPEHGISQHSAAWFRSWCGAQPSLQDPWSASVHPGLTVGSWRIRINLNQSRDPNLV